MTDDAPDRSCACGGRTRREFLLDASALAAAILGTLGASREEALAARVTVATGSGGADEKRYAMPASDGVTIDHDNDVIVTRYQNHVYAFSLSCPHQNTALRWLGPEGRFQCPRHESKYTPDGTFISGRATRSMDRFAVRKEGNQLVVDLNRLFESDKQPGEWKAASIPATT